MDKQKVADVIDQILKLEKAEIDGVLNVLRRRWGELYPEYELVLASVPKNDSQAQKQLLEFAIKMVNEENP